MENADFHDFLERMRDSAASDLVRSIKSFIVDISNKPPDPKNDSKSVQDFMTTMEVTFKEHPMWVGASNEVLESSGEGLEKYLMTKLFNRTFAPLPEEAEHDQKLFEKISLLQQFVRPEQLDIPLKYQNESSWLLAQKELQKINTYKAPRDKLVSMLNCSRVILNISIAMNEAPPGADEFLPVLIYVTIKANPPQLYSNLLFIQRYRHHSRLVSEAAYFFTNLVSAESFIFNMDGSSLSMDEKEFQGKMQAAREQLHGLGSHPQVAEPVLSERSHLQPLKTLEIQGGPTNNGLGGSLSDFTKISLPKLQASGSLAVIEAHRTGHLAREFPFLYARVGDLTVEDVDSLLADYKELALKYYSLYKAVEKMTLSKQVSEDFKGTSGIVVDGSQEDKLGVSSLPLHDVVASKSRGTVPTGVKQEDPKDKTPINEKICKDEASADETKSKEGTSVDKSHDLSIQSVISQMGEPMIRPQELDDVAHTPNIRDLPNDGDLEK